MSRLSIAAFAAAFVVVTSPAFALCNPGTPHCIKVGQGSRLEALQKKLKNPGTLGSGDITCKNASLCGIDTGDGTSPGYLARRGGGGHVAPPVRTAEPIRMSMHTGRH